MKPLTAEEIRRTYREKIGKEESFVLRSEMGDQYSIYPVRS